MKALFEKRDLHDVLTLTNSLSYLWALFPTLADPPTVVQFINPQEILVQALKRSGLSDCWQMHRYYIYKKYFLSKLTTLSLYQKSFKLLVYILQSIY